MTRVIRTPRMESSIRRAYAAGANAPADEDAATRALMVYCWHHGAEPGDAVAEAWCLGWYQARYGRAH